MNWEKGAKRDAYLHPTPPTQPPLSTSGRLTLGVAKQSGSKAEDERGLTLRRQDDVFLPLPSPPLPSGAGDMVRGKHEHNVESTTLDVTAWAQILLGHLLIVRSWVSNCFNL